MSLRQSRCTVRRVTNAGGSPGTSKLLPGVPGATPLTDIGQRVDALCKRRGLSRRRLARITRRCEKGFNYTLLRSDLKARYLPDLAAALDTSVHFLITGNHDPRLTELADMLEQRDPDLARVVRVRLVRDEGKEADHAPR